VTLEHSTDGGATWTLSTPAAGSPMPYDVNPALAVAPGLGLIALWASETDLDGDFLGVLLRLTVDDSVTVSTCTSAPFDVANNDAPTCAVNSPLGGTRSANVTVGFDLLDPEADALTITFEHSTDAGATWSPSTPAGVSPMPFHVNPVVGVLPGPGRTFIWDSAADVDALVAGLVFRLTVDDLAAAPTTCSTTFDLDNNDPPTCLITGPSGTLESGDVDILLDTADPEGDLLGVTFEHSTDGGATWTLSTPAGTSPAPYMANPAVGVTAALAQTFRWDSVADVFTFQAGVMVRVTVDDGLDPPATCTTTFDVDNNAAPACMITAPSGTTEVGDTSITFDATDANGDLLAITFEHSTDGGTTWALSTTSGGSPVSPNPAVGVVPALGLTYVWESQADLAGVFPGTVFRVTVDDGIAPPVSCTTSTTASRARSRHPRAPPRPATSRSASTSRARSRRRPPSATRPTAGSRSCRRPSRVAVRPAPTRHRASGLESASPSCGTR
jgi:hypothetical protein